MTTQYFAHYAADTLMLIGYYNTEVHSVIPEPNRELTKEEWQDALAINANQFDNNVDFNLVYILIPETPEKTELYLTVECLNYLKDSQYYIERFNETGAAIPANIAANRVKCFTHLGAIDEPINARIDTLP